MANPGTVQTIPDERVRDDARAAPGLPGCRSSQTLLLKLDRLGLRTLADVRALPATALQARFGPAGRDAHAWASGTGRGPGSTRASWSSRCGRKFRLPAPMASREMLMLAIRQLVIRAFNVLRSSTARSARPGSGSRSKAGNRGSGS